MNSNVTVQTRWSLGVTRPRALGRRVMDRDREMAPNTPVTEALGDTAASCILLLSTLLVFPPSLPFAYQPAL